MVSADYALALTDEGYPCGSLMEAIHSGYVKTPSKLLVMGQSEGVTYAEAYRRVCALAGYLQTACGIGSQSTVVFSACNVPEYPIIAAAVQACAARLVLLSPTLAQDEVRYSVDLLHPDLAIVSTVAQCETIKQATPHVRLMTLRCLVAEGLEVERIFSMSEDDCCFKYCGGSFDLSQTVLFSSGSSGIPKAIVHRSSSLSRNAQVLADSFAMDSDDVLFLPVPFSHVYGFLGIYVALLSGSTIVTSVKYHPETSLSLVSSTRATIYFGVATMYLRELRANQDGAWNLNSLRAGLVAGSCCPETVFKEYERRWGCRLMQSYGMTETAAALTVSSLAWPLEVRARCVGVPLEGVDVIVAGDGQEILCKTPSMMVGVVVRDGTCALEVDGEGWFHTGDVGSFDDAGRLRIVGRVKDMIIRGGINIYPAEVENVYQANRSIAECCLVGYEDPDLGERTCLCVIMKDGEWATSRDLRRFAQGRIEKCKVPDIVLKIGDFPRLANGKIDKKLVKKIVEDALVT